MKSLYDSFVNTAKTSRQGSLQAHPGAAAEWRRDRNAVDDINIQSRRGGGLDDFPLHAERKGHILRAPASRAGSLPRRSFPAT